MKKRTIAAGVVSAVLTIAVSAFAGSIGVVTRNTTNQRKSVQQSVGGTFVEFNLEAFQSTVKTFPTPSSGSATLTVYTNDSHCGTSFDVSKSTGIVTLSSGTCSAVVY
jgi:hypothetical protein